MSNEGGFSADHDLLSRLNALKKTHIDLDDKKYQIPVTAHVQPSTNPSPARALHNDLVSRFKSLNGTDSKSNLQPKTSTSDSGVDASIAEEDAKTVENLLAELGGEGAWNFEKDEATEIDDLLCSANLALKSQPVNLDSTNPQDDDDLKPGNTYTHELPNLDVEISKLDPDPPSDEDLHSDTDTEPRKSKKDLEADIDREANDLVAKLKDELKHAPPDPDSDSESEPEQTQNKQPSTLPDTPTFSLPTIPTTDPKAEAEADLASRFASLTLPTTLPTSTLPSAPSTRPAKFGSSTTHNYTGHSSAEIDSWCIICLEDASLRCLGCDGDLYCAKCWIEGHRGPDAGYEERRHKAVEYNKDGKKKKEGRRRVAA